LRRQLSEAHCAGVVGRSRPKGGPRGGQKTFDDVTAYDPNTDRGTTLAPLPGGRHAFAAAGRPCRLLRGRRAGLRRQRIFRGPSGVDRALTLGLGWDWRLSGKSSIAANPSQQIKPLCRQSTVNRVISQPDTLCSICWACSSLRVCATWEINSSTGLIPPFYPLKLRGRLIINDLW
jgi:hypothetical protein